ncbi:DUF2750 domain-containing protein [Variovorax sp. KK3]|uniref:DUF2750 domain-containing protein n=1 Tax=Variovorax sp. KK3 TaxID=1855728 RepID=UPI00097CA8C6|nr:DUF2750 domain-containing protein [Variovorax sp. KK3]
MKISMKQIEAVVALSAHKRYARFIKLAADQRLVWGLHLNGWALAGTDDGMPVFPLWPAREYAELCVGGSWADYVPKSIELDDLFDGLLPSLDANGTKLGVFYTAGDKGVLPNLADFERDLRAELARIE